MTGPDESAPDDQNGTPSDADAGDSESVTPEIDSPDTTTGEDTETSADDSPAQPAIDGGPVPAEAGPTQSAALDSAGQDADQNLPKSGVGQTCETCPVADAADAGAAQCPADFTLSAPCRILKVNGTAVQMSVSELAGFPPGSYTWTTTSAKITLTGANTTTVTVQPKADPSTGRDAETITVTRKAAGCPDVTKTVTVTVAKVTFSVSATQRYGYDNFDTPANPDDDHVCIKQLDFTTVKVDIAGGAIGTDFDFVCEPAGVCDPVPPGGTASFDLRLDGKDKTKHVTVLHARVKCPSALSFAHILVHVYKETKAEAVVAKIWDSTVAATDLRFPTADYAAHTATVNAKVKEAVVTFDITNFDASNAKTDVHFDLDGNGVLSFDIKNNGGVEFDKIKAAMTGTGTKTRVAVIKDMKSFYFLKNAAAAGDTTITVTDSSVFGLPATQATPLGTGANQENVTFASTAGSVITLGSALTKDHPAGDPLEFPAGGWSTDPILIREGSVSLDAIKWTIPHEVGHRVLKLADIVDDTNFMHWLRAWTDFRLRYCPRTKKHEAGTENQWEKIPRT
ncbi:MAG: hypothetical protein U0Q18_28695 [Bryobacteraceae bacterium]